jgi:hypothetical protein
MILRGERVESNALCGVAARPDRAADATSENGHRVVGFRV